MTGTTLRHDAMLFSRGEELASSFAPWLVDGLDGGEAAVVATTATHIAMIAEALGARAHEVTFIPNDEWYVRPATTITAWERLARDSRAGGVPALRIVGEVRFGEDRRRHASWTRYESALNTAFARTPAWIVCPYDVGVLPASIVEDAWRTHTAVWNDGVRMPSGRYLDPPALFDSVPESEPDRTTAPVVDLADVADLGLARDAVRAAADRLRVSAGAAADVVLAVGEVATNAIRHGGGIRRLRMWAVADELVCEVVDRNGVLADPLVGLVPPAGSTMGGMGLWVVRQLTEWLVVERAGDSGSVVRFGIARGA
jgi:anti-sigma regulatory factor (Ser/Thr protein kinase)